MNSHSSNQLAALEQRNALLSPGAQSSVLNEVSFRRMIGLERKRTERSRKPFLLMLLDAGDGLSSAETDQALSKVLSTLAISIRETDVAGWYKSSSVAGVVFTQITAEDGAAVVSAILGRVNVTLRSVLSPEQFRHTRVSFHLFPEDWDHKTSDSASNPALYPDLLSRHQARKSVWVKRVMDIAGSALALVVLAPLFLSIAAAIKLSSQGPVYFRQRRIGQYGVPFIFLKFRSMYINNDASTHRDYVQGLIRGRVNRNPLNGSAKGVYKLTDDARITPLGRFLRKTSLDELPQLFNVLRGHMSLVGPRPPVAYEVEVYDVWHRRRILEAKPGITGLWQVNGRSQVSFDEMVRLDLRYARTWSPWLDVKILLRTPQAVVSGVGAC